MTHRPVRRKLPAWLVGFLVAAVIFVVVLLVSRFLGFGDDPVVEGAKALAG